MPVDFEIRHDVPAPPRFLNGEVLPAGVLQQLQHIRAAFLSIFGNLDRWCVPVSTFVAQETGLPRVAGYYHSPDPVRPETQLQHCWNETGDGRLYIDLTHQQFEPDAPGIAIVEARSQGVLVPAQEAAETMQLSTYFIPQETINRVRRYLATLPPFSAVS